VPADYAVASLDIVLDGTAVWRTAKDYRPVGDHQARAIRLKDAGRRQNPAMAGDFPTIHLSATTGRKKMINELDRLMTITDLSEMLVRSVRAVVLGNLWDRTGVEAVQHLDRDRASSRRGGEVHGAQL
jgi:hypothetical protein